MFLAPVGIAMAIWVVVVALAPPPVAVPAGWLLPPQAAASSARTARSVVVRSGAAGCGRVACFTVRLPWTLSLRLNSAQPGRTLEGRGEGVGDCNQPVGGLVDTDNGGGGPCGDGERRGVPAADPAGPGSGLQPGPPARAGAGRCR